MAGEDKKNSNNRSGEAITNGTTNQPLNTKVEAIINNLIINIFFDGTGNNLTNTHERLKGTNKHKGTSYENFYTNVALLYMSANKSNKMEKLYIEGSGTRNSGKDDLGGLGMGTGPTGIGGKTEKALSQIKELVERNNATSLTLNMFGFSRGSAFARYFCNLVKNDNLLKTSSININSKDITINFLGLYDTVASIHAPIAHKKNVSQYKLNIGKNLGIKRFVHLTAENEYRSNFRVVTIDQAIKDGIGYECSLPGAHADIGGAYNPSSPEEEYFISCWNNSDVIYDGEIHWSWFAKKGYYRGIPNDKNNNLKIKINGNSKVVTASRIVLNNYQYISFKSMRDIAIAWTSCPFNLNNSFVTNGLNSVKNTPILNAFNSYVEKNITNKAKNKKNIGSFSLTTANAVAEKIISPDQAQALYQQFIHNSLRPEKIPYKGVEQKNNKEPMRGKYIG